MNEELSYAEMLEIPVETVTVRRKESGKKRRSREDLADRVVESVNDRVDARDPAYAESTPIERMPFAFAPRMSCLRSPTMRAVSRAMPPSFKA